VTIERLKKARKRTVGTKQTAKAIEKHLARLVFVAQDADEHIVRNLIKSCEARDIEYVFAESMGALGKACGIEVGAASAAIIEE